MIGRRSLRTIAAVSLLAAAGVAGFAPGCKKESEALVLVNLQATSGDGSGVAYVEISIGEPAPSTDIAVKRVFELPTAGLPTSTTFDVGVYVPAGVTGSLPVTAVAKPAGTGCNGYIGKKMVKVTAGQSTPVLMTMSPSTDVCTATGTAGSMGRGGAGGGSAGTGGGTAGSGVAGTGGTGGSSTNNCAVTVGTPPPPVAAPSLGQCAEYDTLPAGTVCDESTDTNNPYINDVVVSPDGQLLATAANDSYSNGVVNVWRLQGNTPTLCSQSFSKLGVGPAFVAFSPDGQYLGIAWNNDYVYVYRVPTFALVGTAKSSPNLLYGIGFSADSQTVFSIDWDFGVDGTLYADRLNGTAITSIPLGVDPDALAVSPVTVGGVTTLAVAGYGGNIGVYTWDGSTLTGPTVRPTVATAHGNALRFSRNGMMLVEGTADGTSTAPAGSVRFWSLPITAASTPSGGAIMLSDSPIGLSFSPAGDQIAISFGTEVDIWNVSTRAFVARHNVTPPSGQPAQFADAASFSASGGAVILGEDKCGKFLICSD